MQGSVSTLAFLLALIAASSNAFVVPGPSKIVSGRSTRASTSQVIVMGRGDTRTTKGKRMRHSYGKCRPQKQKEVVYFEGEVVKKAAPVARRWESIEYDEASMPMLAPAAAAVENEDGTAVNMEEAEEIAAQLDKVVEDTEEVAEQVLSGDDD